MKVLEDTISTMASLGHRSGVTLPKESEIYWRIRQIALCIRQIALDHGEFIAAAAHREQHRLSIGTHCAGLNPSHRTEAPRRPHSATALTDGRLAGSHNRGHHDSRVSVRRHFDIERVQEAGAVRMPSWWSKPTPWFHGLEAMTPLLDVACDVVGGIVGTGETGFECMPNG